MRKILILSLFLIFCYCLKTHAQRGLNTQTPTVRTANDLLYTTCAGCWSPDSLGNLRAQVRFSGAGNVARVILPWRRRDSNPAGKRIIIQDGKTGNLILNKKIAAMSRDSGDIWFEPVSGPGLYYIYYMPYRNEGRSNYPKGIYLRPDTTASLQWLNNVSQHPVAPNCTNREFQSIDRFNAFDPMELVATKKEVDAVKARFPGKAFIVFPESRDNPIRMKNDLPFHWVAYKGSPLSAYRGKADRGEYFAYQLGIFAQRDIRDVRLTFSDLTSKTGEKISAANISCINTTGVTYDGHPFTKQVDIPKDQVQALWCGIDVPADAIPGQYTGTVTVRVAGEKEQALSIYLEVTPNLQQDGGAGQPWKMTRLKWLNSTLAQQNDVIAPYIPLVVEGDSLISLLGRKVQVNAQGFPEQIQTFFTPEMTDYTSSPNNLLGENIHFHFTRETDGKDIKLNSSGLQFTLRSPGTVQWKASSSAAELQMDVDASLEFDGFLAYTVKVTALQDIDLKEITMHIPLRPEVAPYMMGLGLKGGYRPDTTFRWKWDVATKNQDGAWIGAVNAGLQYSLRDEKYSRPLNTNFYLQKPLLLPSSWGNEGNGGITIGMKGKNMLVNNYSGTRHMRKGEALYYNFTLLITPFHTLNTDFQWATRFYHRYNNLDSIRATGATVINIHHATPINPWINYPFIEWKRMKGYIDSAHALGMKVKIYNTVRELSNHAYETFALRSLGHEVYSAGPGGGFSWLQEHIGDDYIPAWFVPEIKDAAIINSGMNRWHNYYVEGMNWLVQHAGIDGIYLDDVAFDRVTMKRIKRVLTRDDHPGIIDLHSANQYNKHDGFNNSANLYMEHFPYLNRLWFGEYFDYEKNSPDFFLTEVSGIPFGLMGEMLEGGGNPWRGMIYGMTNRMPWTPNSDPRPIWKIWDEFGIRGSKMIGYWSPSCPVKTSNDKVLATVYRKSGSALVSLASWADDDSSVQLRIDWTSLGIDPAKATIVAPAIPGFQPGRSFRPDEPIPVQKAKGWLLEIR